MGNFKVSFEWKKKKKKYSSISYLSIHIESYCFKRQPHRMVKPTQTICRQLKRNFACCVAIILPIMHCAQSVQIRSCFWPVFPCIRTEYRKIRTRNNSVFGHFSRSDETVKLWVRKVMQHEDNLKFAKVEKNLIEAVSKKDGSKKLFCHIVVLK